MTELLYFTTMISNGVRDGLVLIIHLYTISQQQKKWVVKGGTDTNSEQLLAAGYSACFNSALSLILSQNKVNNANPEVEITIELIKDDIDNDFKLWADILEVITQ